MELRGTRLKEILTLVEFVDNSPDFFRGVEIE